MEVQCMGVQCMGAQCMGREECSRGQEGPGESRTCPAFLVRAATQP